jgi:hypothetical protein
MCAALTRFFHFVEVGALFHIAEFLLDGLDLFVEVILALALFHLAFDAPADAPLDLQNVEFRLHQRQQVLEAFLTSNISRTACF